MPEKARVFAVDDELDFLDSIGLLLERTTGHNLILKATTLVEALEAIKNLPAHGIQVALVDGNLTKGIRTGADGRQIIEAIREFAPEVKIVGMSSEPMEGVDIYLGKDRIRELGQVITQL